MAASPDLESSRGSAQGNSKVANGLEGVVVAQTVLSRVDGQAGRLTLRGYDVEEIVGRISFEEICHLLWQGHLPEDTDTSALRARLGQARERIFEGLSGLGDALRTPDGMDALRAGLAHLCPDYVPGVPASELVAAGAAVYASAWYRLRSGQSPVPPDRSLSQAQDLLRMVHGKMPSPAASDGLDDYLVTVSDHGLNASTFTCRVIASTGSDLVSAIVGAVGALKGPLHGGAPGPVLDMLDAIGSPENAESWIENELKLGRRIMGMGHRIYRVRDPRAKVLEKAVERVEAAGTRSAHLSLARAVESVAAGKLKEKYPNRTLAANVEFYTAVLLDAVGLPRELFSPAFAISRIAGWCAHFAEQQATGRLIRPESEYVGPIGLKLL